MTTSNGVTKILNKSMCIFQLNTITESGEICSSFRLNALIDSIGMSERFHRIMHMFTFRLDK